MADHSRVSIRSSGISCGVVELSSFSSDAKAEEIAFQLASYLYHPAKGTSAEFAIFSDTPKSKGADLAKWFGEHGAHIMKSPAVENSKTGNLIIVFVWEIPHRSFREWYKEQRINRIKQQS